MDSILDLYGQRKSQYPDAADVTARQAADLIQSKPDEVVVVDCRTQREREVSRISGSITAAEFQERKEELRGKKLLMHCLVGGRALPVSEAARSEGFDAATIAGSLLAWATENLPLVDDNGPTSSLLVPPTLAANAPASHHIINE